MGEWLDPAPSPHHDCYKELPGPTRGQGNHADVGRRYRCSCGKIYKVVVEAAGEDDFLYAVWYST